MREQHRARRRGGRKALAVLLGLAIALLAIGVLADRAAVAWAEGRVADQLTEQAGLAGDPDVDVRGFPFLTQALNGRYDDVRIVLTASDLAQPPGTAADIRLIGVRLPLSTVVSGEVQELPVDRVEGAATLSYQLLSEQLAEQLGKDGSLSRDGDGLAVTTEVEVSGYTVPLTATGTVALDGEQAGEQELVIDVDRASGAGVDVPEVVVDRAKDLLDLRHPMPVLPFGLRYTGVTPAVDGVVVEVAATDVVLTALE